MVMPRSSESLGSLYCHAAGGSWHNSWGFHWCVMAPEKRWWSKTRQLDWGNFCECQPSHHQRVPRRCDAEEASQENGPTCVGSQWFLVEHGELHLPSSCWTQSQTPCAERRDGPNSTAIPWRFEGYKYDFGCIAGTPCWRLLAHWCRPRIIRCTARIYMDYPLGRKTSTRLYLVWKAPYKKTSNIHVRSLVGKNVDKYVRRCSTMRKAKVGHRKTETRQCVKTTRSLLRWPRRHRAQGNPENARKLEIPIEPVVPCKIRKSQHRETCCYTGNRMSKTCMHRGSRRIHQQAFGRNPTQWWWPHCRKRKSLSESWQTCAQVYSYSPK